MEVLGLARVKEASRTRYPWPQGSVVGADFLPTDNELVWGRGIGREQVVEASVDVLCGRARETSSRAVNPWTTSLHGPQLRRDDRAVAFRGGVRQKRRSRQEPPAGMRDSC